MALTDKRIDYVVLDDIAQLAQLPTFQTTTSNATTGTINGRAHTVESLSEDIRKMQMETFERLYRQDVVEQSLFGNLVGEVRLRTPQTSISYDDVRDLVEASIDRWDGRKRRENEERERLEAQTAEREELQALPNFGMF